MWRAISIWESSPESVPNKASIVRCIPASCPCAYTSDRDGGTVRNKWWQRGSSALEQDVPRALQVGHTWDGVPQLLFIGHATFDERRHELLAQREFRES